MLPRGFLLVAGLLLLLPARSAVGDPGSCKCTTRSASEHCRGTCSTLATEGACACESGTPGGAASCETTASDGGPTVFIRRTRVLTPADDAAGVELWGCHPISLTSQPAWAVARYAPDADQGFTTAAVKVLGSSSPELTALGAVSGNCRWEAVGWPEWQPGAAPALAVTEVVFLPGKATRTVDAWPLVKKKFLGKKLLPSSFSGPAVLRFKTDGVVLQEVRIELVPGEAKKTGLFVQHLSQAVSLRRASAHPSPAEGFLVAWFRQGRLIQLDLGPVFVPHP